MYASKIRYLASAFVDAESIVASAANALDLLKAFGSDKFLPVMINELSTTGQAPRLAFRAVDGTAEVRLLGKRFDFLFLSTNSEGSDLGPFQKFCKEAQSILAISLNFFQRKAHRLAAVQEGFLQKMSLHESNELALKLFNFPPTYKQSVPFEWDWRAAALIEREFSGIKEPTNTITTIKRIPTSILNFSGSQPSQESSDRVRVDFDINTILSNTIARFEQTHIDGFFDQASIWHETLSSEIFSFIGGTLL
jgi:hypothetical protein